MVNNLEQGFFGIGIQNGKTPENLGVLWRSAQRLCVLKVAILCHRYFPKENIRLQKSNQLLLS